MPPANGTAAPIIVTSSQVRPPNTHSEGTPRKHTVQVKGGGGVKLAVVDQYVFLLCLISLLLIGNSEQI